MLLSITTTHQPASDLGYLLGKHPDRVQSFDLSFGKVHVFYPTVAESECTANLLLDVDAVAMVRGKNRDQGFSLSQYVNDRPYVASSLMSVAISKVFRSAMTGQCRDRPDLASTAIPLTARLDVLPVRGAEGMVERLFGPLGYSIDTTPFTLDETFPEWGDSPYQSVAISGTTTLANLLTHIYVLMPVFDNRKHYFVSEDEIDKLMAKGEGWLKDHPEKDFITRRYLKHRSPLVRDALSRLVDESDAEPDDVAADSHPVIGAKEDQLEKPISLNEQRLGAVLAVLRNSGAKNVIDLGCGEGKLLRSLLDDWQFERIVGVDVSVRSLEYAAKRLKLERLPPLKAARLELIHASLMYKDERFETFDAASVVEVIEHLDPPRLAAFERVVFQYARPKMIALTTPNSEYNIKWETLPAGQFRHADHRFEWTRAEFQDWAIRVASEHGYDVRFLPVGDVDPDVGSPTQMAVFQTR